LSDLFLLEEVQTAEEEGEISPQQESPSLPDVFELAREGGGDRNGRASKHLNERLLVWPKGGLGMEEDRKFLNDARVKGLLLQEGVIKKFDEGREGRIHVRQPEHEHLFQGHLTVAHP